VSGNLPVLRNLPKSSLSLPNRHKKSKWPKKAKKSKPNFSWPFFKNRKRPMELKKGQKLQFGLKKAKLPIQWCNS